MIVQMGDFPWMTFILWGEDDYDEGRLPTVVDGQRLSIGGWRDVSQGPEGVGVGGGQTHS
jgi:hypothetical protein